ncbi:beta-lactamase [Desulfarculus baarsii DSM 2075]|uniref:Beta-lactamase n=1 Tax=Desulfarculus baarsii (strain ATCC 33931 / DSM 2075 / LMG 7858 / VKM B-1802 / 2st14) TaxID=644282 RepID=E1QFD4_DESB2|nr:MBL fold metallo-hydrolase [Desulfarculus baarsii]ADK84270.1 beta-lactamase [Desulfarculus baarsii DSM 2075]
MSLRFCVLASGSKGNATYIEGDGGAILVDAGLSARELQRRMAMAELDPGEIQAVVLTHEHGDHCRGVRVLARRLGVPVLATPKTWAQVQDKKGVAFEPIQAGQALEYCGLHLQPFSVSHDAADPIGLTIGCGGARLGLCTDLGVATKLVQTRLGGCHALILEANHDPEMLSQGPYPPWLKQRVRSRVGHLSNHDSAQLLTELMHVGLGQVVLAHLSETNNFPELARRAAEGVVRWAGLNTRVEVAAQGEPTPVLEVEPRGRAFAEALN